MVKTNYIDILWCHKEFRIDDGEMVCRITSDGFAENAVCHATCMTNYLLKRIKDDSEDYSTDKTLVSTDKSYNFAGILQRKTMF
jgi:hypothetical protein